jgi:hypothetical protein
VSRISLNDAFRVLVKAGRTPGATVAVIDDQTKRSDGKLHLWCGDGKDPLPRDYIRDCLRFELGNNEIKVFGPIGLSSGRRLDRLFPYYVDADQIEALIAEPTKLKSPGGRKRKVEADAVEAELERRRRARKPTTQRALAKHFGVSIDTISRRLKNK